MTTIRSNFHTHTAFCDGKDSPAAMVLEAIALGFTHLGFSGHAPSRSEVYAMSPAGLQDYREQIERVRYDCAGQMEILCGVELDLYSDVDGREFDYCIASVHSLEQDGRFLYVDESPEAEAETVAHYGGSFERYAEAYYAAVIASVDKHKPQIIGHLDLLTKFREQTGRVLSPEYWDIAEAAVRTLSNYDIPFEINTGAMAKGYRTTPYPDERLLRCIRKCGGSIVINSDCHDRTKLNYGFAQAAKLAVDCGFNGHIVLTGQGRLSLPL